MNLFTPKGFLQVGGVVLVLVGVLGMAGVIGPTPAKSMFGAMWWFDTPENVAHLTLGVVGLLASFTLNTQMQKMLVMLLGVVGVLVGLYNLTSMGLLGANLEVPTDMVLHLVVGTWALYASLMGAKSPAKTA